MKWTRWLLCQHGSTDPSAPRRAGPPENTRAGISFSIRHRPTWVLHRRPVIAPPSVRYLKRRMWTFQLGSENGSHGLRRFWSRRRNRRKNENTFRARICFCVSAFFLCFLKCFVCVCAVCVQCVCVCVCVWADLVFSIDPAALEPPHINFRWYYHWYGGMFSC